MELAIDESRAGGVAAEERLDASAFPALYESHKLAVYRYLLSRTRSEDDALDLTAVTFERAYANLGRFRTRDGGVVGWLLRIARNAAIDAHRRQRSPLELVRATARLQRTAVEAHHLAEQRLDILDLVARLPEIQRDALLLRYVAGLTAREIGRIVGKREGAVQKQIERGLATLREALK